VAPSRDSGQKREGLMFTQSLYDSITLELEKFKSLANLIKGLDPERLKIQDEFTDQLGGVCDSVYKDVLNKITDHWNFIKGEIGDILVDVERGQILRAYIKEKESD
jgi:hypothetical protein